MKVAQGARACGGLLRRGLGGGALLGHRGELAMRYLGICVWGRVLWREGCSLLQQHSWRWSVLVSRGHMLLCTSARGAGGISRLGAAAAAQQSCSVFRLSEVESSSIVVPPAPLPAVRRRQQHSQAEEAKKKKGADKDHESMMRRPAVVGAAAAVLVTPRAV